MFERVEKSQLHAPRDSTAQDVLRNTHSARIIFLEKNLTELGAFALERRYIKWYGRKDLGTGILRNLTDGGEGTSGRICDSKTRYKISMTKKGKSSHNKGKIGIFSLETRNKISENNGTKRPEVRAKISASKKGIKPNIETRAKMAIARKEYYRKRKMASLCNAII